MKKCETCHGHGRVTYDEHPHPKPEPFGSVFPCPVCSGSGEAEEPGVREMFEGRMRDVVDASRSGWWRFNERYDRNGYCDNPARGY